MPSPTIPFELHLTEADDGSTQQLLLGGKVVLDLPTGSAWEYDEPDDYPDQELASYCTPPTVMGREVFEAVRTGTTVLAYWRDGGPDRFDVEVQIVDGPGAAPPSTELVGAALWPGDEGTTIHIPRNGRISLALDGQHSLGRDWVVAEGDDHLVAYCEPERYPDIGTDEWPGPDDATWTNRFGLTAVTEGTSELVVEYRDTTRPEDAPLDSYHATVVVDPAPAPGQPAPAPSGSATAPFEVALTAADAGGTFQVLRGGKVLVTLPDPDGTQAAWALESVMSREDQLGWACQRPVGPSGTEGLETTVLEVGDVLGSAPLAMGYAGQGEGPSQRRDSFAATLVIVDGPGAETPTAKLPRVTLTEDDADRTVRVPRNTSVSVTLPGQHGLGLDWALVKAGAGLRGYCEPWIFSEGPGPEDMVVFNVFPFVALDPGPAPLLLEYRDTTKPDSEPPDTFEATVIVE